MNIHNRQDAIARRMGSVTLAELTQEVGASRRTVLRDLANLRENGFVIHGEPGRGGGLRLDPASVQTTARLSVPEVFALLISVAAMRAGGNLPFAGLADAGLAKIEKALPRDKVQDLRRLLDCLHIGKIAPAQDLSDLGDMDPELLPAFEMAFLGQTPLRFSYHDRLGSQTLRQVEPQAMLILPPLWYLVAWDPTRGDFRHFRIDRISAPEPLTGEKFRRRHVPFAKDVCPYRGLISHPRS